MHSGLVLCKGEEREKNATIYFETNTAFHDIALHREKKRKKGNKGERKWGSGGLHGSGGNVNPSSSLLPGSLYPPCLPACLPAHPLTVHCPLEAA